ncbi:hypothetical protein J6590_000196 [Homalodisca vitripennis]|nr:hypothetical protein J6590_000196 [Homalodisca vitripennis]
MRAGGKHGLGKVASRHIGALGVVRIPGVIRAFRLLQPARIPYLTSLTVMTCITSHRCTGSCAYTLSDSRIPSTPAGTQWWSSDTPPLTRSYNVPSRPLTYGLYWHLINNSTCLILKSAEMISPLDGSSGETYSLSFQKTRSQLTTSFCPSSGDTS